MKRIGLLAIALSSLWAAQTIYKLLPTLFTAPVTNQTLGITTPGFYGIRTSVECLQNCDGVVMYFGVEHHDGPSNRIEYCSVTMVQNQNNSCVANFYWDGIEEPPFWFTINPNGSKGSYRVALVTESL